MSEGVATRVSGVLALALAVVLAAAEGVRSEGKLAAGPRAVWVTDARDVGPLDFRGLAAVGVGAGGHALRIAITTWRSWEPRLLTRAAPHRLEVLFDVDADGQTDSRGRVVFDGGALRLWIEGGGWRLEPLELRRAGPATVTVTLPGDVPPNPSVWRVRIAARSLYVKRGTACDPRCSDRIPDEGWLQTSLYWSFPGSRTRR